MSHHISPTPVPPTSAGVLTCHPVEAVGYPPPAATLLSPAPLPTSPAHCLSPPSVTFTPDALVEAPTAATPSDSVASADGGTEGLLSTETVLPTLPVTPPSTFKRFKIFIGLKSPKKGERKNDKLRAETGGRKSEKNNRRTQNCDAVQKVEGCFPSTYSCTNSTLDDSFDFEYSGAPTPRQRQSDGVPSRRSFRLAGYPSDLGSQRNMLPLWLEENTGVTKPMIVNSSERRETLVVDNTFEARWDSLRGKNKVRSSYRFDRPPGWEDVGHTGSEEKNKNVSKNKFCPSFVIKDVPGTEINATNDQRLTPVSIIIPNLPHSKSHNQKDIRAGELTNNFDFKELSDKVDNILPECFPQFQKKSLSYSNVASQSASITPTKISSVVSSSVSIPSITSSPSNKTSGISSSGNIISGESSPNTIINKVSYPTSKESDVSPSSKVYGDSSPLKTTDDVSCSNLADRHLWESSDSFICEDFTFANAKSSKVSDTEKLYQPRSYSQILLNQNMTGNENSYLNFDTSDENSDKLSNDVVPNIDSSKQLNSEVMHSNYLVHETQGKEESNTSLVDLNPMEGAACASPSSSGSLARRTADGEDHDEDNYEASAPSLPVTDNEYRYHWIKFDADCTNVMYDDSSTDVSLAQEVEEDNHLGDQTFAIAELSQFTTDADQSIVQNLMQDKVVPASSSSYGGQLIRTYSQRGRRASKRVFNSVTRRISAKDYGKLPEPRPPMYSKAVLTMQCGPGLFEETSNVCQKGCHSDVTEHSSQTQATNVVEVLPSTSTTSDRVIPQSLTEPTLPLRVGSLRVPRLPTTVVRRSVSFNAQKTDKRDSDFQRPSERRSGSFKRAMSGLNALARSFKLKSGKKQFSSAEETNHSSKGDTVNSGPGVKRSDTFSSSASQIPHAPRLPRRAKSQTRASRQF